MCGKYEPDVQAQCDCVNCGQPWEKCKAYKERAPILTDAIKNWPNIVRKRLKEVQLEKERAPQMKITVIVKDRFGGLVPQVIMIDGATPVHKIGQAIVEAVRVQTVNDGTGIVKATIGPDEIYNAS